MDDRRRRHPARRGPDRAFLARRRSAPTACSCGSTCPSRLKFTPPRYQAITGDNLVLLSSARRRRAGAADRRRPRRPPGPRRHAHADHLRPRDGLARARSSPCRGTRRSTRWPTCCPARATPAPSGRPVEDHELVVFGPGDTITLRAADQPGRTVTALEVLLLGGLPIREPIVHYGPFVMNTRDEIIQAIDDFNAGRMGTIPAIDLGPEAPASKCRSGVVRDTSNDTCSVRVRAGGGGGFEPEGGDAGLGRGRRGRGRVRWRAAPWPRSGGGSGRPSPGARTRRRRRRRGR